MKYIIIMALFCTMLWLVVTSLLDNAIINYIWAESAYIFIMISFIVFMFWKVVEELGD